MSLDVSRLMIDVGADVKGAESGLDRVDRKLAGLPASVSGVSKAFTGAFSGAGRAVDGLVSKLSGIGLAAMGIRELGNAAAGLGRSMGIGLVSSMENVEAQLLAFTKDGSAAQRILADIRAEADKTPFSFEAMAKATAGLMPAAKMANTDLMGLVKTAQVLAASNPAEGLEGAAFALREAVSGDFTSVIERFNLPRSAINKLKDEGVPALEVVRRSMAELGFDADLVANLAGTMSGKWSTFNDTLDGIRTTIARSSFNVLKGTLTSLQGTLDRNKDSIQAWADRLGTGLGRGLDRSIAAIGRAAPVVASLGQYFAATARDGDHLNDFLTRLPGPVAVAAEAIGKVVSHTEVWGNTIAMLAGIDINSLANGWEGYYRVASGALSGILDAAKPWAQGINESIVAPLMRAGSTVRSEFLAGLLDGIQAASPAIAQIGAVIGTDVVPRLIMLGAVVAGTIEPAFTRLAPVLGNLAAGAVPLLARGVLELVEGFASALNVVLLFTEKLHQGDPAAQNLAKALIAVGGTVAGLWALERGVSAVSDGLTAARTAGQGAASTFQALNRTLNPLAGSTGQVARGLADITRASAGGTRRFVIAGLEDASLRAMILGDNLRALGNKTVSVAVQGAQEAAEHVSTLATKLAGMADKSVKLTLTGAQEAHTALDGFMQRLGSMAAEQVVRIRPELDEGGLGGRGASIGEKLALSLAQGMAGSIGNLIVSAGVMAAIAGGITLGAPVLIPAGIVLGTAAVAGLLFAFRDQIPGAVSALGSALVAGFQALPGLLGATAALVAGGFILALVGAFKAQNAIAEAVAEGIRGAVGLAGSAAQAVGAAIVAGIRGVLNVQAAIGEAIVSGVQAAAGMAASAARSAAESIASGLRSLPGLVADVPERIGDLLRRVPSFIADLPERASEIILRIPGLIGDLPGRIGGLFEAAAGAAADALGRLGGLAASAFGSVVEAGVSGMGRLIAAITGSPIGQAVGWVVDEFLGGFTRMWAQLDEMTGGALSSFVDRIQSLGSTLSGIASGAMAAFEGAVGTVGTALSTAQKLGSDFLGTIQGIASWLSKPFTLSINWPSPPGWLDNLIPHSPPPLAQGIEMVNDAAERMRRTFTQWSGISAPGDLAEAIAGLSEGPLKNLQYELNSTGLELAAMRRELAALDSKSTGAKALREQIQELVSYRGELQATIRDMKQAGSAAEGFAVAMADAGRRANLTAVYGNLGGNAIEAFLDSLQSGEAEAGAALANALTSMVDRAREVGVPAWDLLSRELSGLFQEAFDTRSAEAIDAALSGVGRLQQAITRYTPPAAEAVAAATAFRIAQLSLPGVVEQVSRTVGLESLAITALTGKYGDAAKASGVFGSAARDLETILGAVNRNVIPLTTALGAMTTAIADGSAEMSLLGRQGNALDGIMVQFKAMSSATDPGLIAQYTDRIAELGRMTGVPEGVIQSALRLAEASRQSGNLMGESTAKQKATIEGNIAAMQKELETLRSTSSLSFEFEEMRKGKIATLEAQIKAQQEMATALGQEKSGLQQLTDLFAPYINQRRDAVAADRAYLDVLGQSVSAQQQALPTTQTLVASIYALGQAIGGGQFLSNWDAAVSKFVGAGGAAETTAEHLAGVPDAASIATRAIAATGSGAATAEGQIGAFAGTLGESFTQIAKLGQQAHGGGRYIAWEMIAGITSRLREGQRDLNTVMVNMLVGMVAAGQRAIDAHSPSRLAADKLGDPIPQGAAMGVERTAMVLTNAVTGMVGQGVDAALEEMTRLASGAAGIAYKLNSFVEALLGTTDPYADANEALANRVAAWEGMDPAKRGARPGWRFHGSMNRQLGYVGGIGSGGGSAWNVAHELATAPAPVGAGAGGRNSGAGGGPNQTINIEQHYHNSTNAADAQHLMMNALWRAGVELKLRA